MYIEDLIERLVGYGKFLFEPEIIQGTGWEYNFATSVANQLSNGNSLTEKQATLAIKILRKYKTELESYFKKSIDLDNPVYRNPFRRLTEEKTIKIEEHNGKKQIVVRFAYDQALIKKFQEYVNNSNWKSLRWGTVVKPEVASWDHDIRAWTFSLKEENILWLQNNVVEHGFQTDDTFTEHLKDINSAIESMYSYAPYLTTDNGKYVYANASSRIKPIETDNLIEALFHAKNAGISAWDEDIDETYKSICNSPVTQALLNTTKPLFVDSTVYHVSQFEDVIKYGGPILIIIPGGSETHHTMKWHAAAQEWGIPSSQMSVMFRMPNESHGTFNQYVKDNQLNNDINADTKIVFVSTKIPKPLIKSGIRFNTVLNLGYYRDLHFSMSVVLNSTTNVCYYNNKQPHGVNVVNS